MSRPSPRVQALRDVLLAVLRDADRPMTTQEVLKQAFPGTGYRHYSKVYSNLRAMDRLGLVVWHPWDNKLQCARWEPVAQPTVELDVLEEIWRLGSSR